MNRSILVIAGEVSGDMHAARIVEELKQRDPDLQFWGVGGDLLQQQGMDVKYHVREMAVVGIWEVLKRYAFFKRVFNDLVQQMETRRPDAVLLVDYPGFNLRFAKKAHACGIKVLYYICPQVWAWNKKRIPEVARTVDRLMVIFPFEVDVFKDYPLKVDFVGHPLVDKARKVREMNEPCGMDEPFVALLPGSRRSEVERILPVMWETALRMRRERPELHFAIAAATDEAEDRIRHVMADHHIELGGGDQLLSGKTRPLLNHARAAMVASGTATMETALLRCPMVVVYKTSWLTYLIGRLLIKVPYLGMVNIVSGRALCPEFIQQDARANDMAEAMIPLLDDSPKRRAMLHGLEIVLAKLDEGRGSAQVASIIESEIHGS
ncbi:MAG: lipid-A-disaccharide synthase [Spartobacteria bacterium]|nr:lipid-A-disaccharide synthase [Spartobacteria bacterium]